MSVSQGPQHKATKPQASPVGLDSSKMCCSRTLLLLANMTKKNWRLEPSTRKGFGRNWQERTELAAISNEQCQKTPGRRTQTLASVVKAAPPPRIVAEATWQKKV